MLHAPNSSSSEACWDPTTRDCKYCPLSRTVPRGSPAWSLAPTVLLKYLAMYLMASKGEATNKALMWHWKRARR